MRIAISGTHSLGKSTFVRNFLAKHPEYSFEDEPYRALMHEHEILFGDHQTTHHINLQLDYCLAQVNKYQPGDNVIFDRPPSDFVPYADYTATNAETDIDKVYVNALYERIKPVLSHLDLIVFVPITEDYPMVLEDDGHRPIEDFYRDWVDNAFKKLYREECHLILPEENPPKLVEITGPREERIKALEKVIEDIEHGR